jgi:multiple sugar transport system permease protein
MPTGDDCGRCVRRPAGRWLASPRAGQAAEARAAAALASPAAVLLVALLLGPSAAVIVLSVTDWQLGQSSLRWVGLANYAQLFGDRVFWRSLANTFVYVGVAVPLSVFLGLALAVLIEAGTSLRTFYRAVFFLPVTATLIAMAVVWEFLLHPTIGLVNLTLERVGIPGTDWLKNPDAALLTLCAIGVWQAVGLNVVLFLAGLKAIPHDLYESADVDGADSAWERFRVVTWPLLGPATMFVSVVTGIRSFQVFDTVEVLTKGGPSKATEVLLYTMYTEGFTFLRTGYACAVTVVFMAIVVGLTLLQARLTERRTHYS